jgi:hypothetical protein
LIGNLKSTVRIDIEVTLYHAVSENKLKCTE